MSSPIRTFLLLGASGDLAGRLLLPALADLLEAEPDRRDLVLVGAGAEDWDDATWQDRVRTSFGAAEVSPATLDAVLATTRYQQTDVTDGGALSTLLASCDAPPALYFALPPAVTVKACTALLDVELPEGTVLVLEKPFGTDQASAADLNRLLTRLVPEAQVHRVDHFLGRSTVLNLLGLRFANRLFEPVWNNLHVERVDIVFDEQLALENRARYYDSAGALMDMIQSHLLQVLALVAMEPPAAVDETDLRDAKAQVLRACRVRGGDPTTAGRRARYTAGQVEGRDVPDYAAEPGVDPDRGTETLAELVVEIDNGRWSGVPFRLRSGKALGVKRKEVLVTFKPAAHVPVGLTGDALPDRLRLVMGPDRITLGLNVNGPADPLELDHVEMDVELGAGRLPPYGEVLAGVLDGDPLLSVRGDTAEQCWRIVDPVLQAWRAGDVALEEYPAGSDGPAGWS
ncbi:glucose-6-phosphate dehydrogenase [Microlunatus capsulatus]|uniref:Glucose-6-phosphate 1-dehydrogenase n=1 Tax=Microlunatus capsulatus TaxID=99117 RepID=A0ABS4ZCE7_9ACTN|nr:glucose-6-phosphate dehydrogenase [Microlunatus capsulatus]MBP2418743.1 glucose-6-phosphate 1-dehydrogenase [Microlunatus capsulatus]